ncbi:nitrate/nitrite two-component system sensor histidine kinase NarQ [Erwinia sorbitola]|uniref:Sensor protein n=1 Tax=Erwinia sorbitola TaxID=2681984 RepID=A0A6I6EFP6_9GAMM|nr:nitrate/nitrite two-component system sensor histidine kinase NarQ [Erwinia sorbitola]MTD28608.1 nitrate/nitrite two-component system sensor histidine kinase NarQ [Erwinia sorbitola]QGU86715.1 nitrate/nitrite two-component system sensor histidine kinase NarQ [Erwinia sorbitola]
MATTRSLTHSLARALFTIVLLSVISSGLALLTLSGSLRDAEAVNLSGSLRMQVWRLNWDATTTSPLYAQHIADYQRTLHSPALQALDRFYVPATVRQRYRELLNAARQPATAGVKNHQQVMQQVEKIDQFVLALQHWAELKMRLAALTCLLGFLAIALLVYVILRHIRQQVVGPLQQLVSASEAIEQTRFHLPPLSTDMPNELGVLARAFTRMSGELEKSWRAMSLNVEKKTADLTQANRRLRLLYACSQQLSHSVKGQEAFQQTLQLVSDHEKLSYIALITSEFGLLSAGQIDLTRPWQKLALCQHPEQRPCGELRWQADDSESPLMNNVASLLVHALELWQTQQQVHSLLLLEERTTMARELHDSLAQSLTFLRIQLVRLKRTLDADASAARAIVEEFEQALVAATQQLRELLTTFRLKIEPTSLARGLEQMIAPLRRQTTASITLACQLDVQLPAQQHIHVLQIVREALLNAVRHSHATEIGVKGYEHPTDGVTITINDNGVGIKTLEEPDGHYGLKIMHERAALLNGTLTIQRDVHGGTGVSLHFNPQTELLP